MKETLLVLDLDETLLYATEDKLIKQEDFAVGAYNVYILDLRTHDIGNQIPTCIKK